MTEKKPFWAAASLVSDRESECNFSISLENMVPGGSRIVNETSMLPGEGTLFRKDDVLFGKLRPYLRKNWLADRSGKSVGDIHVYRPTNLAIGRYLNFVVQSNDFISWTVATSTGAKMPRTNWESVRQFRMYLPPLETQRAIADYLDRETAEIDSMLAELDELAALLEERQKVKVSQLVNDCEGRYPRKSIGSVANMHAGDFLSASAIQGVGPFPVFGGNGIRGYFTEKNSDRDRVLIGRQGALCGNVHIAPGPFWATEHAIVCEPFFEIDLDWFAHTLRDKNLGNLSTAAAQPGISVSMVARQSISYPPLSVQREIGKKLVELDSQVKSMVSDAAELKSLLLERRSALITEVVTGRKQVV